MHKNQLKNHTWTLLVAPKLVHASQTRQGPQVGSNTACYGLNCLNGPESTRHVTYRDSEAPTVAVPVTHVEEPT